MKAKSVWISSVLLALLAFSAAQDRPKPEQIFRHEKLEVTVPDFPAEGLILDIGGGGEGVIGQLKGTQVIAIDLLKRELEEAPAGPLLKIVMDARDLKFLDGSFPTATVFFTFMYIAPADHETVLREIHRALAPGGRLLVWDVVFPKKTNLEQSVILYPLHISLPKKEINTGYGVRFLDSEQGLAHFIELARRTGFQVAVQQPEKGWFFVEFRKST